MSKRKKRPTVEVREGALWLGFACSRSSQQIAMMMVQPLFVCHSCQGSGTYTHCESFRVIAWRHQQEVKCVPLAQWTAQQLRYCFVLQELLCDRSRDNAQIEAELRAVLSEEPPSNARHHLHTPAAREALVARLKQVQHLAIMLATFWQGVAKQHQLCRTAPLVAQHPCSPSLRCLAPAVGMHGLQGHCSCWRCNQPEPAAAGAGVGAEVDCQHRAQRCRVRAAV